MWYTRREILFKESIGILSHPMSLTLLFGLPQLTIDHLEITEQLVIVSAHCEDLPIKCPLCGQSSRRIQSRYTRVLQDSPLQGKTVCLRLQVRRFSCENDACNKKIFAERFPELTSAFARRTQRLTATLSSMGFLLGGKTTARLGHILGMQSSRDTVLRLIRTTALPAEKTPRILGVDEWAYRRNKSYGTLLVDLERNMPLEMLADRKATTLATWLRDHPGVLVISRDRAGEYAQGARQGAPQAIQIADRYHLVKKLSEVVERILLTHRKALQQIRFIPSSSSTTAPVLVRYPRPERQRRRQRTQQARQVRYEQIRTLVAQGETYRAIAEQLHLNWKTVDKYAKAPAAPAEQSLPLRAGVVTPFASYLYARWQEGEHNAVRLYREVAAQGYTGSRMTVQRFLRALQTGQATGELSSSITGELTPHRAVGLLLKHRQERTEEETKALVQLSQVHADVGRTQQLMEHFLQMLRQRQGEELDQMSFPLLTYLSKTLPLRL